ncbi:unnamed protein product, partial [Mesorhabditis spiculigera]
SIVQFTWAINCRDTTEGNAVLDCSDCMFCQTLSAGGNTHTGCGCGVQSLLDKQTKFKFDPCDEEGQTTNDKGQIRRF